ncbi:RtcB family protein [Pontibacter akesuensis]|uniref:3'-phosphate/5'-hydroxy nucleic acid ligase n=1 Tax=Pontibacter akesuensis TaxID=388950 RepID=A0A1I7KTN8_9BACT|nr:RtcB family protein [Pontibacter akesuensis]GHA80633.1 RNA-splicing ligase RtcB [Pontibacter akesuensis]SFV00849.1 tRNA-splicing ligase RtcB [Pontibacter akesuensis]
MKKNKSKAPAKLSADSLLRLGFPSGKPLGTALNIVHTYYKDLPKNHQIELLQDVLDAPDQYQLHSTLGPLALAILAQKEAAPIALKEQQQDYTIYGASGIDEGAFRQMEIAMRLPVARAGALMPDAHQGYGLPIGGVLATENAVIPYGVGVDIGCRMSMSIYDINTGFLSKNTEELKKMLLDNTRFGHTSFKRPKGHDVMDRPEFSEIPIVRELKDRAFLQLGTSGGGNHFVEFGTVDIKDADNEFNLPVGSYLAVLSHSGSRGLGANIAGYYTKVAMDSCRLPQEAKHLAWLDLATEAGQEYWLAMNLAGDYASACHHQIHERLSEALGESPLATIENHHNFAWKEKDAKGREYIVHRKGATPAGKGVLGIIPGSMATPGFLVRGKGEAKALNSASHGAGRVMSRTQAKNTLSKPQVQKHLKKAGIEVLGSDLDEAPMVYKDIHQVMAAQQDLVEVVGVFNPKIVRMNGDEKYMEVD